MIGEKETISRQEPTSKTQTINRKVCREMPQKTKVKC